MNILNSNFNKLIESIDNRIDGNTIYCISLDEFKSINNIDKDTKYNDDNWPKSLPSINLFFYGIINKYWPKIKSISMITNTIVTLNEKNDKNIQIITNNIR